MIGLLLRASELSPSFYTFLAFESRNSAGLTWTQRVKHFVRIWPELGV